MPWSRAIDLVHWADTADARGQLPWLIRQLIRRTVPSLQSLNFPAWEQVQRPGFDGEVETLEGNQFVPAGRSGWEMGVDKDPKGKADKDFQKRTEELTPDNQKEFVFVFVTPRVWQKESREKWVEEKSKNSHWRAIIVLDVNDLEHWLETAPDIDVRFTRLTGRVSQGVQDLESYWNGVRSIAEHPLAEAVFTASREEEVAAVAKWLSGPPSSLFVRTNGLTDGLDFLAALGSSEGQERLQDGLVVHTVEAWRDLAARRESLVLIAAPSLEIEASAIAGAVDSGHYVFLSGPRANMDSGQEVNLRRQDYYAISQALDISGYSEARAMSLAKACCGSSSILKRLITRHPDTMFPPWSRDDVRPTLAPFALIGGWVHVDPTPRPRQPNIPFIGTQPPLDRWVVTELIGCDPDNLLARWQGGSEPLFLRFGDYVLVASREDAWFLLGSALTKEQIKRFCDLALIVLEEDNPAFELAPDQRWLSRLHGKTHSLSEELRRSVVESLVLMVTYRNADSPVANVNLQDSVRWVLEQVLPADASWQRWASFGNNLMSVAEADPEFFLSRVEADLGLEDPELPKLFQDKSHSVFGGAIHSALLWALEGLAWKEEYLPRVAVCLAKLAARDPGGTYANRPANSLRELFLFWLWHTNASLESRIKSLNDVLKTDLVVGWKLLRELLPSGISSISHNTHMPRWRPWADGWSRKKIQPEIPKYAKAVAELVIQTAGSDAQRWSEVLDGVLRFSPEITNKVFLALERINEVTEPRTEARFALWCELRQLVSRHERYEDASWAFDKAVRDRLATIRDRLEPVDAVRKNHWLFDHRAEIEGMDRGKDFATHQRALHDARLAALKEIISQTGAEGIFRLLDLGCTAHIMGWMIGEKSLLLLNAVDLPRILDSSDNQRLGFISAFINTRFQLEGWTFVNQLPIADWTVEQIANFARYIPPSEEVWRWLKRFGANVESEYWKNVRIFWRNPNLDEIRIAATSLIGAGRVFSAVEVLHSSSSNENPMPSDLIAEVLEAGFNVQSSEAPDRSGHFSYCVQELVKALQDDKSFDRVRLARIEWGYLPLLEPEFSRVGPDTLVRTIESQPQFFVDLLKLVYRGENDDSEGKPTTEKEQLMVRYAHHLLDGLSRLPGTKEDGTIDCDYLREWMMQVRIMATECGRRAICDLVLGQFIARGSQKLDDDWPSPELAKIMEDLGSEELFRGFINGVLNSRGVVTRDPRAGGELERELVKRYRRLAQVARPTSSKLAEAFLELARHYESYAQQEDAEALRERLGR